MAFEGKVAIVTGGGQGIGKAYCLALLSEGGKVSVCDINEHTSSKFLQSLPENLQKNVIFKKCDVVDYADFKDTFDKTMETFGRIDIVINNAGVCGEINWKKTIDVNLIGVIHGIQLGFQYMSIENGGQGGFIINTSSTAGLRVSPFFPVYCATKHAVVGLTKSYGSDYHFNKTGIKMMALCPNGVETDLLKSFALTSLHVTGVEEQIKNRTLMEPKHLGQALIKVLEDGKNGSLLRIEYSGMEYV